MRRGAAPRVVLRTTHDARPNRIPFDVPDRRPEVFIIERAGEESPLPQMPADCLRPVHVLRIAQIERFHDQRERIGACRNADKVDVVGHEAIGQYFEPMLDRVLQEQLQISPAVVVAEEDVIASIAALGDVMMGETRDDYSGEPWHAAILLPSSGQSQEQ